MHKFLLITLVILQSLLISCVSKDGGAAGSGKATKFTIEGLIANGKGSPVYFEKIGANELISLDTIILDDKGEFQIKSSVSSPEFFILRTDKGAFINMLIYGREKIKITADYADFTNYSIEGSSESSLIKELSAETNRVISEIDKLNIIARDSIESPNYADLRIKAQEKYQTLVTELKQYSQDFIDKNPSSLISLLALSNQIGPQMMVFDPAEDFDIFEKVDSTLTAMYPSNPLVLNLHEYVSITKAQLSAEQQSSPGALAIGTLAPDIELPSPDGKIIKLSSLRGKIVLLDFWAAWCQPCRMENPNLVENYNRYNKKGFEIYQVSLDRTREDWLNGIKQDNLNWTHVSELKYWNSAVVAQYGIQGIPMSYLLDKDGKVIASSLRGAALGAKLAELFNE